jgi:hypothetical protein
MQTWLVLEMGYPAKWRSPKKGQRRVVEPNGTVIVIWRLMFVPKRSKVRSYQETRLLWWCDHRDDIDHLWSAN